MITIALSKGRIFEETMPLLKAAGVTALEDPESSRKLILPTNRDDVRLIIVRASDVPTYVQYGAADAGVAGKDVLLEHGAQWGDVGLAQPLDLGIGRCTVIVARPRDGRPLPRGVAPRVATKYVNLAAAHFARKGLPAEIIHLQGSIEVAPSLGLADRIVDITETGETLKANGLVIEETVLEVSARLVVNRVALKLHAERLRRLVEALRKAAAAGGR